MKAKATGARTAPGRLLGLLLVLGAAAPLQAAAQGDREAQYRALVDEAITEYEARNFAESRALFLRAHALSGNARTLRGLGMVAFELRDYPESVERLEQALAAPERPLEGTLRADTEALLVRARAFVGHLELRVEPAVAVRLRIDGDEVTLDAAQRVLVAVGDHTVEIAAPGFVVERRAVTIVGGEDQIVRVPLRRLGAPSAEQTARAGLPGPGRAAVPTPRNASTVDEDGDGGVLSSPWFWAAAALVVGGGVAAGVLIGTSGDEVEAPLPSRSGVTVDALELAP